MRTPRIKAGVNNENNTSKCPHKPRTNPLMLICRPGVPSLLPTAFCSGGNGTTRNARDLTGTASRRFAAPHPGAATARGGENSPGSMGSNAAISASLGHRSIPSSSGDVDRWALWWWMQPFRHAGKLRVTCLVI